MANVAYTPVVVLDELGQPIASANPFPVTFGGGIGGNTVGIDQATPGANKVTTDVLTAVPAIYNVTLTSANTEYSQAMPASCRFFEFHCRTATDIRFAFATGKVAAPTAPYMTLPAANWYATPQVNQGASPSTLYVGSATAGVVVEIIAWV
jgi:hypothetical protein